MPETEAEKKQKRIRDGKEVGYFPISASAIANYEACPLLYKERVIDRIPQGPAPLAELGRELHRWIAWKLALDPAGDKWEPVFSYMGPPEFVGDFVEMQNSFDKFALPDISGTGDLEVTQLYEWNVPASQFGYKGKDSDEPIIVQLKGKLDRLQLVPGWAIVDDWKTGWKIPSERTMEQDLQAMCYDVLVKRNHPWVDFTRFRLWPARFTWRCREVTFDRAATEVNEAAIKARVLAIIHDKEFKPNPFCRVHPPGTHVTALTTREMQFEGFSVPLFSAPTNLVEAKNLGGAIGLLERMLKIAKEAIKPWARNEGPVELPTGGRLGLFSRPERVVTDMQRVVDILRERYPNDWPKYLRLDLVASKRLLDGKDAIRELQELVVYQQSNPQQVTWRP